MRLIKAIRPNGVDMDTISTVRKIKIELGKYGIPLNFLGFSKNGNEFHIVSCDANNMIIKSKNLNFKIPLNSNDYLLNNCLRLCLNDQGIVPNYRRNKFTLSSSNYISLHSMANIIKKHNLELNEVIYYLKTFDKKRNNRLIDLTEKLLPNYSYDSLEFLAVYLKLRCKYHSGSFHLTYYKKVNNSYLKPFDVLLDILSEEGFRCETSITHLNQLMIFLGKRMFKKKELDFSNAIKFKHSMVKINSSFFDRQRYNNRRQLSATW